LFLFVFPSFIVLFFGFCRNRINKCMTEQQFQLRSACVAWMQQYADHLTHAVTLTLKPYRVLATNTGEVREALTSIEASATCRHFLNRLNGSIYGNAVKRSGKSITAIPVLEGQGSAKLLHYHCALGGFPLTICDKAIAAKITNAWHLTPFGNEQVDIQPMHSSRWLTYMGKEIGLRNADGVDWENVRLSAASLT
jgi:hypothetical protein